MSTDTQSLTLKCLRCGNTWQPLTERMPKRCPKCNSPYWYRPRMPRSYAEFVSFLQERGVELPEVGQ